MMVKKKEKKDTNVEIIKEMIVGVVFKMQIIFLQA